MADFRKCPACGARVAVDPDDVNQAIPCEKCGGFVAPNSTVWNPYDPPSSPLGQGDGGKPPPLEVPSSFSGKFGLAFRLFGDNLVLYSLIMLTVWLPANIAFEYLIFDAPEGQEYSYSFRYNSLLETIFGPISVGALVFAVARRMEGEKVGYFQAMGFGFRNWGRLFSAQLIAGFFVCLGYIALIVPGVILSVRYSLLAPVVVLERSSSPRERSTDLTVGRRWPLFFADLAFYSVFNLASYGSGYALDYLWERVEWLDGFWLGVASDCVFSIADSLFVTVIVLFYLEARAEKGFKKPEPTPDFEIRTRMSDAY